MRQRFLLFLAIATLSSGLANAQTVSPSNSANGGFAESAGTAALGRPGTDEYYVENGLRFTNVGVVLSKLAQQKASSPDVKSLAKDAVDKHMAIGGGLVQSAKTLGIKVPAGLPPKYEAEFHDLQKLSGVDFDKRYLDALIGLQHDDFGVMLAEYGPGGSKRPDFKDQAEKDVTTLSHVTDQAAKLQKKLGKS